MKESTSSPPEVAFDDWERQRERKYTLGLAASPAQRLAWLEEAIAFAHRAGALPRPRPRDGSGW